MIMVFQFNSVTRATNLLAGRFASTKTLEFLLFLSWSCRLKASADMMCLFLKELLVTTSFLLVKSSQLHVIKHNQHFYILCHCCHPDLSLVKSIWVLIDALLACGDTTNCEKTSVSWPRLFNLSHSCLVQMFGGQMCRWLCVIDLVVSCSCDCFLFSVRHQVWAASFFYWPKRSAFS